MESRIKKLFETIQEEQERLNQLKVLFGADDSMTRNTFRELVGMEKAFEIITGKSVTQYLIDNMDA